MWKDDLGRLIFTTEPYHCYCDDVAKFVADLSQLGLQAEIWARSGWNPGKTILISVYKPGVDGT